MATAQNPVSSVLDGFLLDRLVESSHTSPVARALGIYHIKPTAEAFGVSRATLEREVARGHLIATRFGGKTYFSRQAILDWWQACQTRPSRRGRRCASRSNAGVSAGVSA